MIICGVSCIAACGQLLVGLIELPRIFQLDGEIQKRERLSDGSIEQLRYRQASPPRHRTRSYRETLPELLQRVGGEWPVLRLAGKPKLGVTRLNQHAHQGGHLRVEGCRLCIRIAERALGGHAPRRRRDNDERGARDPRSFPFSHYVPSDAL